MNTAEREQLKENLRDMIVARSDGIDLDTPFQWVVEGIKQPEPFFASLPSLIPNDAILYCEGCLIAPDVAIFYKEHQASNAVGVVRDTIFPVPAIYHVAFSSQVATRLLKLAANRSPQELFDHFKAYRGESLLFAFHDAFTGCMLISERVSENIVAEFCRSLGVTYRREQTKKRDPEQLRHFLRALEHPDQVLIADEPWWRRLWRQWTGR